MRPLCSAFAHNLLQGDWDVVTQALVFEEKSKLTGDMLVKVDRMSMANSLEMRSPLLDDRLAEVAARAPHRWKMRNGAGKQILLKAVGDRLPTELLNRKKMGFGVPLAIWFRGPLRAFRPRSSRGRPLLRSRHRFSGASKPSL